MAAALKNTHSLIFEDHFNQLLLNFGVGGEPLKLLWYEARPDDPLYLPIGLVQPRQISLSHLTEEVYRQQLLPSKKMDNMCRVFLDAVGNTLQWNRLGFATLTTLPHSRHMSLKALCRNTMVDAATRPLFGDYLHTFEPKIVQHRLGLNDSVWMILLRYPEALLAQLRPRVGR